MLRRAWNRLTVALSGLIRQRITLVGVGFSFIVSAVGALAFLTGNNLLFLILGCLLATLLVSGFISRLSLAGLELDFVFPEHISARRPLHARMKLRNEKSWMPSFSIYVGGTGAAILDRDIYFAVLPGGATVETTVNVSFHKRGRHSERDFRLRSTFPFGLTERHVQVTLRREALVYPCLDPQPGFPAILSELQGAIAAQIRDRSHDFHRIRPYEHGESARHVDWKATARTRALQVREFAREQDPVVELYLDTAAGPDQYEWFEKAVELAAFLSWETTRRGAALLFRTHNFQLQTPAQGSVYDILRYLALVEPAHARIIAGPGRDDSVQVVLTAHPQRVAAAGWSHNAHVFGPSSLA